MSNDKKILVGADTTNGIYHINSVDDWNGFELEENEQYFYESLNTQDDAENVACFLSPKMYKKIDAEYGIKPRP